MIHEEYMFEALIEARKAAERGEVPVGAVIVADGEIIARAHNEMEQRKDATAHAEILAIQRASDIRKNWRLNGAALYVTLEPCTMCVGAIRLSRIGELVYGCADSVMGAVESRGQLLSDSNIQVFSGVQGDQAKTLLQDFFKELRSSG